MSDYQQRQQLIAQLSKWWTDNGWRMATLEKKSLPQLLGTRNTAIACKWEVKPRRRRYY